jgi:hypothetical protein
MLLQSLFVSPRAPSVHVPDKLRNRMLPAGTNECKRLTIVSTQRCYMSLFIGSVRVLASHHSMCTCEQYRSQLLFKTTQTSRMLDLLKMDASQDAIIWTCSLCVTWVHDQQYPGIWATQVTTVTKKAALSYNVDTCSHPLPTLVALLELQ